MPKGADKETEDILLTRSAAADRRYQSIIHTAGSPTAVGKPAAIQSWIRRGGSIHPDNHKKKNGSRYTAAIFYEMHQ